METATLPLDLQFETYNITSIVHFQNYYEPDLLVTSKDQLLSEWIRSF